jgi:protein ImuA
VASLDRLIGGGVTRGVAHEIMGQCPADAGAATGFALMLAALVAAEGHTVWIADDMAGIESAEPYGPGLSAAGIDPRRLIIVAAGDARALLQAAEDALGTKGVGAVIAEPFGHPKALDRVALRRLALAAGARGATLLMLRGGERATELAVPFRWQVAAAESRPAEGGGPGPPCLDISLVRNRLGPSGRWRLAFDPAFQRFHEVKDGIAASPAFSRDRLSGTPHRPAAAPQSAVVAGGDSWRQSA